MWLLFLFFILFQAAPGQLTTLLVVTGYYKIGGQINNTQLIDLTKGTQSCQNWKDYPISLDSATGSILSKSPIVCGGEMSSSVNDQCHMMDMKQKSWTFFTKMTTKRSGSASTAINGSLFVTGGLNENKVRLSSTEYITADGKTSVAPDLPSPRASHCMVSLPSGNVMIIGGHPTEKTVEVFDPNSKRFAITVPSLIHSRFNAGCAIFNSPLHNFRPVVLAVGGLSQATAEIYDYTQPNSKWTEIESLPTNHHPSFWGARAVTSSSGQGVIVQAHEHFYELTCQENGCSWKILPQELLQSASASVLFNLPAEYDCN